MRAATSAQAYGRRRIRFMIAAMAIILIVDGLLWVRLARESGPWRGVLTIALAAGTATVIGLLTLQWRSLSIHLPSVAKPAFHQALATHIAGHVVAAYRDDPRRVGKATLTNPCTQHRADERTTTESSLRSQLVDALAGIAAEEVFLGESGSHAAEDLTRATRLGGDMVARFGMTGSYVSLAAAHPRRSKFIGAVLDDARTRKDLEALLRDAKRDAVRLMLENRHVLIRLRDALLRHTSLTAEDVRGVIAAAEERRNAGDAVLVDLRFDRSPPMINANP